MPRPRGVSPTSWARRLGARGGRGGGETSSCTSRTRRPRGPSEVLVPLCSSKDPVAGLVKRPSHILKSDSGGNRDDVDYVINGKNGKSGRSGRSRNNV